MIENVLKTARKQKTLTLQQKLKDDIPKTREISMLRVESESPGPLIYSVNAMKNQQVLEHRGANTQSTVSMDKMSYDPNIRSRFLWDKHKSDYQQGYFHQVQAHRTRSCLTKVPSIDFERQLDRDTNSYMKEAARHFTNLQKEKIAKRMQTNHNYTLNCIE